MSIIPEQSNEKQHIVEGLHLTNCNNLVEKNKIKEYKKRIIIKKNIL